MLDKDKAKQLEKNILDRISNVTDDENLKSVLERQLVKIVIISLQEYEKLENQ